ncbi:hypothetical protein SAMN05216557_10719 [Sphingomonas carotinifaciens]|uniref:Response receiver domain-containing protein n=1 Tax=Sphingomonas carotinifaciens TaxID=1166323 RepID=A0A1G7PP98_9SPHN|nr:hypothetical protein SAMN05216557_10719 [Sphingomonas carotinifaciens]
MISASSVAEIFRQSSIGAVAIIDDAFDSPEQSMTAAATQALFDELSQDQDLLAGFIAAGHDLQTIDHLTLEAIVAVKATAKHNAAAQAAWNHVKVFAEARRTALDEFAVDLSEDLKVSVEKISAASLSSADTATESKNPVDDAVDVVFLDYELQEGEEEGTLSSEIVDRIYRQFAGKEKAPLVILMSSKKLDDKALAAFQRRTKVLSGMFYFVPKDELFDKEKRHYRLAAFAKSLATGRTLQRFVTGVEAELKTIQAKVFADVRSLSIGDFAFLQKLRLHEDGQPLGEYLLWLMNAHLVKELLVSGGVRAVESKVNALSFEDLPPTQSKPSISLATLYSSAVLRPMGALPEHATDQAEYLQFGDLFRKKKGKQVWMCITAPCDLAFSPTRPIRSGRSILFLPGTLQPIDKAMKPFEQRQPRTELVRIDDKAFRIIWDPKEVARADWSDIHAWKTGLEVERIARLNTPFALEIQRSFASDLTRIGMPAPPPFYNPTRVRLVVLDEQGKEVELTASNRCDGYLSGDERGMRLVMGESFMDALPEMLGKAEQILEKRFKAVEAKRAGGKATPGNVANAEAARDKVAAARKDAETLSALKGPFQVPLANRVDAFLDELLAIAGEGDADSSDHIPLRLTILPVEDAPEAAQAA